MTRFFQVKSYQIGEHHGAGCGPSERHQAQVKMQSFDCLGFSSGLSRQDAQALAPPRIPSKIAREGIPITQAQVAEYSYVASVNSEVFHYPTCKWAKKISERNLVGFKSREQALESLRAMQALRDFFSRPIQQNRPYHRKGAQAKASSKKLF